MVLEFSGSGLFRATGLEQYTGDLRERWGQEGSNIVNLQAEDPSSGTVLYTVSTGKKYFVTQIVLQKVGGSNLVSIKDDATTKFIISWAGVTDGSIHNFNFTTPLLFETNVKYSDNGADSNITVVGWEE